jgi:hypothetical protein
LVSTGFSSNLLGVPEEKAPMSRNLVHYLPIATTVISAFFAFALWRHWGRDKTKKYLMWWMIGVIMYGVGTLTESITTVFGWNEVTFRSWYIAGALLGGAPLAQGTVYLLTKKKTADRLTAALLTYVTLAAVFVVLTPIDHSLVETHRLSGEVMEWEWVRLFSPFVNTYAVVFLIGGAIWSAVKYFRTGGAPSRVWGNVLIAIGAILPGIGGGYARAGTVEVLYVAELIGIILIWAGYRLIVGDSAKSIHAAQQTASAG